MTLTKVVLALACLMCGMFVAQEAQVTPLVSKDLADVPGKEGLMITVVYPPGSSDPIHRHNAHAFVYVLEGSIVMQVRGGKETTLTPGQTFYEGPDDVHVVGRKRKPNQTGEIRRVLREGQRRSGAGARQLKPKTASSSARTNLKEKIYMSTITVKDSTTIYYKDWGKGPVVTFSHGWPLNSDAWDGQMLFLAQNGFRVVAHDRRGHGRSSQACFGNDMDGYADELAAFIETLDLKDVTLVAHCTGGGEVARYIGCYGTKRVAAAVLIGAVPPLVVKSATNPEGLP